MSIISDPYPYPTNSMTVASPSILNIIRHSFQIFIDQARTTFFVVKDDNFRTIDGPYSSGGRNAS